MKTTLIALSTIALLAGCAASPAPNYDMRFGDAVRAARLRMTIDPNAGANPDPVYGLDGRSAHEAMTRYQDTFKAPPPVVNVINIGNSVGSSSGGQ